MGGQDAVVTPEIKRANAAVFVFNERVGEVTWQELNLVRATIPPIPVLAFFPAKPPADGRMMDEGVAELWSDLLKKKRELSKDWTDPDSKAVTPLPQYNDVKELKGIAFDRLTTELVRIASGYASVTKPIVTPPTSVPTTGVFGIREDAAAKPGGVQTDLIHFGNVLSIAPSITSRNIAIASTNLRSFVGGALVADPTGRIDR